MNWKKKTDNVKNPIKFIESKLNNNMKFKYQTTQY